MDNLDDLKAIWHTAKTDTLPEPDEMRQMAKKFRSQKLKNKWRVIICSCLLSLLILIVLCTVHFHLASTYVGGGLMAASVLLLALTNIKSLGRFYQADDYSNLDFLKFIEQTRQNQIYYYKKTQAVILLLSASGLLLYLYELTIQHRWWFIGIYVVSIGYLAVMWFIVRPHYFKKNQEKLNATRQRLEKISNQLK
jgi:uncharacterized membrane protein YbhN (UPF0104 family)